MLTGLLEETNEAYAIAKITGIKMCNAYRKQYGDNFISVMPTNLYGMNDNFDLETAHVLPALLRKIHDAKVNNSPSVVLWGTGNPRREFLYVDDLAEACVYMMDHYNEAGLVNIGMGLDQTITELAHIIADVVGYEGRIDYDLTKPDGTPQKLLDVSKINKLGWTAKTSIKEGLRKTYEWYINS